MLSIPIDAIEAIHLAVHDPERLGWIKNDPSLCGRLKIEALYEVAIADQASQVAEVRKDEQMLIPNDIDYFS